MEGELWKWTNYWNGWQSRWFILDNGILSYYKSCEEVSQGCKGSINVSACEIVVHAVDATRLDLNVSGEQYLYLKATNEKERQQWLIALGSAKACLSNRQRRVSNASVSNVSSGESGESPGGSSSLDQALKTKKSELRLYCDLLMQQIHMVKSAASTATGSPAGAVNVDQLEQGSTLLTQTCDTFIRTLDETMQLADANFVYTVATPRVVGVDHQNGSGGRKNSRTSVSPTERSSTPVFKSGRLRRPSTESVSSSLRLSPTLKVPEESEEGQAGGDGFQSVFGANHNNVDLSSGSAHSTPTKSRIHVRCSLATRFPQRVSGQISTTSFLTCCQEATHVFDWLGKSTFAPIKTEVQGYALCIRTKLHTDRERFASSLQAIVADDLEHECANQQASASVALLWLNRYLMFLHNFLRRFAEESGESCSDCLSFAYESTLKPHQDYVTRSVFAGAVQNAANRPTFASHLGLPTADQLPQDTDMDWLMQTKLFPQLAAYLDSMESCVMHINRLFQEA